MKMRAMAGKTVSKTISLSAALIVLMTSFILLSAVPVSATPGFPHQFYGSVTVNGKSAPDNNVLTAAVGGDEYITVTTGGMYGIYPNSFFVKDPDSNRNGDTIQFLLGGKPVGTYTFESTGYTKLDFSTTTTCGDGYCLGDESCSSCSSDCGVCTDPPVITVISPESGKEYNDPKISLDVFADQDILVWMYSLNGADMITFSPNITLTAIEGINSVTVIGISQINFMSGTNTVSFTVDLGEYCGDGTCNNGETCSSCQADCGACPPSNPDTGSSGSSGGSSGGGGGGAAPSGGSGDCEEDWICTEWSSCSEDGTQFRSCVDNNNCGTNTDEPDEEKTCTFSPQQKPAVCTVGARVCLNDDLMDCPDGTYWNLVQSCEFGCDAKAKACKNADGTVQGQSIDLVGMLIGNTTAMYGLLVIVLIILGGTVYVKKIR